MSSVASFRRRAQEVADTILEAFHEGTLPKALAPVFIHRMDNVPCRSWSWSNQLMVAIHGYADARGYRQWQEVGRHVQKGQKSFPILVPMCKRKKIEDKATGEEQTRTCIYGFTSAPVFGLNQTEGDPLPPPDPKVMAWLDSLPLVDVARSWGLTVAAYNGQKASYLGYYKHGQAIAMGVENLSTWAHELCHAADDQLGNLKERGQHWRSETVAELGGAILLETLGHDTDSDLGGCWKYVAAYAKKADISPVSLHACT